MRRAPLIGLSVKAGLVLFAVVAGALAIVYLAVVPQLESRLVDAKISELERAAPRVAGQLQNVEFPDLDDRVQHEAEDIGVRVIVLEPVTSDQLRNISDSRATRSGDFSEDPYALEAARTQTTASGRGEQDDAALAEFAYPLVGEQVVLLAAPLDDVLSNVRLVRRSLLVAGAIALVISWLAGYLLAWSFTRRIHRLEVAAERLAGGDFETRVVDRGRDEVGQLADAFDGMRVRLAVLDRARREFIANASHELRTPLFSLGGFIELLGDDEMSPELRRDFLGEMRDQIDRLTRLATDLLDLSRLDAGQLEVEIEPFDLVATGRLVVDEFRAVAESVEHELRVEADGPVPALGDELRVQQIARALVENAIRHTPEGTAVVVHVLLRGTQAVLEVGDDGPGIPSEDQKHLFERFYRAGGGRASGSGLGLAISRELASRLGGSIEMSSRPEVTVFTLNLPAVERSHPQEEVVGRRSELALCGEAARRHYDELDVTRPGAIAVVAVVAAFLGGTLALAVGKAVGWVDDGGSRVERVLVPAERATPAADEAEGDAALPLVGNGFDASELYRKRAAGVVTIYALFDEGDFGDGAPAASQGSGFAVSEEGYILTNSHVVTTAGESDPAETPVAADTVYVQFRDGERVPAEVVGWDVFDDVGLLRVDPADHAVSPVPLGDSSDVVVGEPVAAIGSPFGQENSLTVGVVSATERTIDSLTSGFNLLDAIQTDAPINRGNSGGPMFNAEGEVVGINAQIRSESGTAEGVGFAIPINAARRSVKQLIETGEVRVCVARGHDPVGDVEDRRALRPRRGERGRRPVRRRRQPGRPRRAARGERGAGGRRPSLLPGRRRHRRSRRPAGSLGRGRCQSRQPAAASRRRDPPDCPARLRAGRADGDARQPAGGPPVARMLLTAD